MYSDLLSVLYRMFDAHPIIVHFPIALLVMYALFELCSPWLKQWESSFAVTKYTFLFLGTIASWVALATGDIAEEQFQESRLVEIHSVFATSTSIVFSLMAGVVLWKIIIQPYLSRQKITQLQSIQNFLGQLTDWLDLRSMRIILSLLGLLLISMTGALGGAIVYGPDIDPFVSMVYKLISSFL